MNTKTETEAVKLSMESPNGKYSFSQIAENEKEAKRILTDWLRQLDEDSMTKRGREAAIYLLKKGRQFRVHGYRLTLKGLVA